MNDARSAVQDSIVINKMAGVSFRPDVGNNILTASTDPPCDEPDWADPDHYDERVSESQWKAQVLRASRRMPELGIPHQKVSVFA